MAQIIHNTSFPNDGLGDPLRTAFVNQNEMNAEIYATKVDKVTGKGLSSNDYTDLDFSKLAGIENGAQVNVPILYDDIIGIPELNSIAAYPDTKFEYIDSNNFTIPENVQALSVRKNGDPTDNKVDWVQLGNVISYIGTLTVSDYLIISGVYVIPSGSGGSGGTGELISKFTSNPIPTIVGTDILVPANETWLIDSVPYTNPTISTIPFSFAPDGLLYFLTVVATKLNTFVGKFGTASTDPSEPIVSDDELFLTTYLISDGTATVIIPPVSSNIYVEKEIYQPQITIGSAPVGAIAMGKKSALVVAGTVPSIEFIIKNNANDYFIGQPFQTTNKTPNLVKFTHLSSDVAGNPNSISWYNPERTDYYAALNEVTLWILDIIDGQKVYRRATSSLQNESVTLEKLAQMPAKTFLGNSGNANAIPQHVDKIDALEMLGLENASSDIETLKTDKANQATTYTKLEVDGMVSSTFKPKGSKTTYANLPTTGNREGDVWNVIDTGDNYVWVLDLDNTGVAGWDKQSGTVNLTAYETKAVAESKYLQIANALAVLLVGLVPISGTLEATDSIINGFGKIKKSLSDIGTAIGLKQDTLNDLNFGAFTNSVANKNTQADTDFLAYLDVLTGKWVKQPFSKLVDYLKGFFQTSRITVTSNVTAANGGVYHNNGSVTYTDPTGVTGMGYYVYIATGTATIGSEVYAVGSYLFRIYNGTTFITEVIKNGVTQKNVTASRDYLPSDHNCLLKIKANVTLTIPASGLQDNFTLVARTFTGATLTNAKAVGVTTDAPTGLILQPFKMQTLFKDGSTNTYIISGETIL